MVSDVDEVLTAIKVELATLNGKVDTLSSSLTGQVSLVNERMGADSRQSAQILALLKDQMVSLVADQGVMRAQMRENEVKAAHDANEVRTDLEAQMVTLRADLSEALRALQASVDDLKQRWAKLVGFGLGVAALSSTATAILTRAMGAE